MSLRQIVLDTETTGLEPEQGHRIIDICCIELLNRRPTGRVFQRYLNPEREVEEGALRVHGLSNEVLADKPRFSEIAAELVDFIQGAELIIHNAPFDVGFLDHEFRLDGSRFGPIHTICSVVDTLAMARKKFPAQRVSLDALCKRLGVDNSGRDLHGALLDARLLSEVYLLMTGGQTHLGLGGREEQGDGGQATASSIRRLPEGRPALPVPTASQAEIEAHEAMLVRLRKSSGKPCEWPA